MHRPALIRKAADEIASVKGVVISREEMIQRAIALAEVMFAEARRIQTRVEKSWEKQLARMMRDPVGKVFTTAITDQCFRSQNPERAADQLAYLIDKYGIPRYLSFTKRMGLRLFKFFRKLLAPFLVPLAVKFLRRETATVILPGEEAELIKHIAKRRSEDVRVNLNHLGEAILGEEEAQRRLNVYLDDLSKPHIECISVKISTIYSQINLLDWEGTLNILADRLRQLYRAANNNLFIRPDGHSVPKFVNLDMEEYRDLALTVALFCKVLDDPEFIHTSAGIVLQSYLPDAFLMQQKLTVWAIQRQAQGGAPIKIRIVKGANLAMEQLEASLRCWSQAPFVSKADTDANYKRMVDYGCARGHAQAVHLGIASHNLFDIAYALLLRSYHSVEQEVCFEMLEGMADNMRRVVQQLSGDMLLYCPAAKKEEFQNAVAYLMRRLDENTAPDNFLRHAFELTPGSDVWKQQAELFANACRAAEEVAYLPRRFQDRFSAPSSSPDTGVFHNEPDTDWALPQNRKWVDQILQQWKTRRIEPIPLVIGGKEITAADSMGVGEDPSDPGNPRYGYTLANWQQVDEALESAKKIEWEWSSTSVEERCRLLVNVAQGLRLHRDLLIGAMVLDTGKTVAEADIEISEAIDFADYYKNSLKEWSSLADIAWEAKGSVLIAPPWNFPCSIPAGGILAALAAGNCVLFKPPQESVLVGWELAKIFWEAGISKSVLQFIVCEDEPIGSQLVQDPRVSAVVLTGATATAKRLLQLRPNLDLIAETGGKNIMVVTALSDRDLAIKDLLQSAFGFAGQKCSACSIAVLEAEVYDDPHFRQQLRDAALSLKVASPWDLSARVNPLIRTPGETLQRGLSSLDEGEEWLVEPKANPQNPLLWSPGIKLGVKPESFTFQNELFGPVLALVRAENFADALKMINSTDYGLTAGIHSLDDREQKAWLAKVEAGNCYINRTMTGAIVQRQPFGGCKDSGFGRGAKAGGPNYLTQLMLAEQIALPREREATGKKVSALSKTLQGHRLTKVQDELWQASVGSYAFYWKHYFSKWQDPNPVIGQDNLFGYKPHPQVVFRVQEGDSLCDIYRVVAAALTCGAPIEVSSEKDLVLPGVSVHKESEEVFITRVKEGQIQRIRLLQDPSEVLQKALANAACHVNLAPVLANGRLELLHYLREVAISRDYHRYGNLGEREMSTTALSSCCKPSGTCSCRG